MDGKHIFEVQKQFARFHKLLVCLVLVYNVERVFHNNGLITDFYPSLAALLFLAAETFLLNKKKTMGWLLALRYIQVLFTMLLMYMMQYPYTFAVCLVLLSLFIIEYYQAFDFVDNYYRIVFLLTVAIPMEVIALLMCITRYQLDERLFAMTFFNVLYALIVYLIGWMYAKHITETNEQIFAQSRLIENVNETNEELRLNQEKVRKANELLGEQKIKLEAAYKKINAVNSEIMIQNDIMRYIASSLDLKKLMSLITESVISEVEEVDVCSIVLYQNATPDGRSSYKIKTRLSVAFKEHLSRAIEEQYFNKYLTLGKTYVDNRVDESQYPFLRKGIIGSLIIVPLIKTGEVVGFLFVGHPRYDYFTENTGFFEGIAAQFIVAVDNANLYARMEYMAIRDGLTGIYNRRHLTKLFNDALNESLVSRSALSVALFDIDHFKNVNDTYGHQFGDVVIKTIAGLAAEIAEENDGIVGRYGGEEFVIIFPGRGLKEAYVPVSELHERVKELGLHHNGQLVHVNVSVGITSYPETCKNPSDLLNRADWAMYYSKQNGRDRITIDNDDIRELVMLK